jgi:molybdate transport system substrate-binding protein
MDVNGRVRYIRLGITKEKAVKFIKTVLRRFTNLIFTMLMLVTSAVAAEVHIFAAASLKNAVDEIGAEWSKESPDRKIISTYAASSALAKQIAEAAPADIFISADIKWMDDLQSKLLIDKKTRVNLVGNTLVLISSAEVKVAVDLNNAESISSALAGGKLAIADVKAVPAGRYGKESLEHMNLWSALEPALAQTENVRATLALVSRGEAPLGIVYASDAKEETAVNVVAIFPANSHQPIVYPAARIKDHPNTDADNFLAYLQSPKARAIFLGHGFVAAP